jgi:hypothetical protein
VVNAPAADLATYLDFKVMLDKIGAAFFAGVDIEHTTSGSRVGAYRHLNLKDGPLAGMQYREIKLAAGGDGGYTYTIDQENSTWSVRFCN